MFINSQMSKKKKNWLLCICRLYGLIWEMKERNDLHLAFCLSTVQNALTLQTPAHLQESIQKSQ